MTVNNRWGWLLLILAVVLAPAGAVELAPAGGAANGAERPSPLVIQLDIEGPIGPASGDYVTRSLDIAAERHAALVILRMDTPGGLDTAMRDIIKKILASPVPVAGFVAPGGARAASAGTYILYASHFAAMAPATNLGAATPVAISMPAMPDADRPQPKGGPGQGEAGHGGAMERKMTNDAVAYIRGLAALRGRNADWAEKAVREAASLPAEEALKLKVIDVLAADSQALARALDGRSVNLLGQPLKLNLAGFHLERLQPDWRNQLLAAVSNPNIAYILMMLGIYGLILELYHPGAVAPGTIGAICLLLALYAFQALPVNYAGLALILLGIGLMIAEAFAPTFGVLGIGGVCAFLFGSAILMDTDIAAFGLSPVVIAVFAVAGAGLCIFASGVLLKVRRRAVVCGREELIGATGTAMADFSGQGRIWIHGEAWMARSERPLRKGQRARVEELDGLTLVVTPLENDKGE